jgi:uncharacterized iron-regulated membrane protein
MSENSVASRSKTISMRQWLFSLHLVVGVALGLYFSLIGMTGSAVVFAPEFSWATMPPAVAAGHTGPAPTLEAVIRQVNQQFPDRFITRIHWSRPMGDRYKITLKLKAGRGVDIYPFVDRSTGEIVGMEPRWIRWVRELHYYLLNGRRGERVNGIGAMLLTIAALSGLAVWWLGSVSWRTALQLNWRRRWPALTRDLHRSLGNLALAPLAVIAVTGVYYAFPVPVTRAVYWLLHETPPSREPVSIPRDDVPPVDLASLLAKATVTLGGGTVTSLDPPLTLQDPIRVRVRMPEEYWDIGRSEVAFDRYSGEVLAVHNVLALSPAERVIHSIMTIHFGRLGGFTVMTRVLWVLVGLTPAALFVSGCLMWWQRSLSKRWRRLTARGGRSAPVSIGPGWPQGDALDSVDQ